MPGRNVYTCRQCVSNDPVSANVLRPNCPTGVGADRDEYSRVSTWRCRLEDPDVRARQDVDGLIDVGFPYHHLGHPVGVGLQPRLRQYRRRAVVVDEVAQALVGILLEMMANILHRLAVLHPLADVVVVELEDGGLLVDVAAEGLPGVDRHTSIPPAP
jgi:hypothetical protein